MAELRWPTWRPLLTLIVAALAVSGCARGSGTLAGWRTVQPGMELALEQGDGPDGEDVLALLYTMATGQEYAIEHDMPIAGLVGAASVQLQGRSTRVLHLAIVLVDTEGREYECARTLRPDGWQVLAFDCFQPSPPEWSGVAKLRLVDRTAALGSQGPVSLKLVGLPAVSLHNNSSRHSWAAEPRA